MAGPLCLAFFLGTGLYVIPRSARLVLIHLLGAEHLEALSRDPSFRHFTGFTCICAGLC
jgi:hypothetical protein